MVVTESTFESYDWSRRNAVIRLFADAGVELRVVKPLTVKDRKVIEHAKGTLQGIIVFNEQKGRMNVDENKNKEETDVVVIYRIAAEGKVEALERR